MVVLTSHIAVRVTSTCPPCYLAFQAVLVSVRFQTQAWTMTLACARAASRIAHGISLDPQVPTERARCCSCAFLQRVRHGRGEPGCFVSVCFETHDEHFVELCDGHRARHVRGEPGCFVSVCVDTHDGLVTETCDVLSHTDLWTVAGSLVREAFQCERSACVPRVVVRATSRTLRPVFDQAEAQQHQVVRPTRFIHGQL